MINRHNLFKNHSITSKLIFASWSPRLHFNASLFQIEDDDILSLYDVLQDSINIKASIRTGSLIGLKSVIIH